VGYVKGPLKTRKTESLQAQRSNLHTKIQTLKDCSAAAPLCLLGIYAPWVFMPFGYRNDGFCRDSPIANPAIGSFIMSSD
jgi:hypothetical protein